MMEICSDGHGEVCYEGRRCPACDLQLDMQGEIDDLKDQINQLESEETNE